MTLTTEHITLLRESWKILAQDTDGLTESFYNELFRREPGYSRLFLGSDFREQKRKLAAALGLVVKHANDLQPILGALEDLGRRHADWGVQDRDYEVVGAAMMHALSQSLGELFLPSVREAWLTAYTAVANTMKVGANAPMKKTA